MLIVPTNYSKKEVRDAITLNTESAITVTEFIAKATRKKFKIIQLPVFHYPRKFGDQTGGNWSVIKKAASESLKLRRQLSYEI
jgi:hypothetical protein